jgi:uncharacterized membrane protein YhhN
MIPLYFVLSAVHLVAVGADIPWLEWATKPLLMPLLALWLFTRNSPRLMIAGLLFSAVGDVLLQFDGLFIFGMAGFAAAHVCYVTFFVRSGALANLRTKWWIPAGYLALWIALTAWLWSGLGDLQIPVAAYSLLLFSTGATSAGLSGRTGLGGLLFVLSDSLIALRIADEATYDRLPLGGVWVMVTYLAAQFLLASGTARAPVTAAANPRPLPS